MKKIKILHCADIHFDTPFKELGKKLSEVSKEELLEVFKKIINIVIDEQVDILLIAGDVFDNFYLEWESRVINDLSNKKNINFYKLKIALKEEYDNLVKVEEDKGTFEESDKKYWDEFHKSMKKFRKEVGKRIVEAG